MSRTGLTLIEVVVALALGVVLVTGVQVLTVRAHQTVKSLRTAVENEQQHAGWLRLLRGDLNNQNSTGNLSLQNNELVISTLNDLEPTSTRTRSMVSVRYRRETEGTLSRAQRNFPAENWPAGVGILPRVNSIAFEVFDGRSWHNQWPLQHMNRRALALRIVVNTEGEAISETLILLSALRWSRHD